MSLIGHGENLFVYQVAYSNQSSIERVLCHLLISAGDSPLCGLSALRSPIFRSDRYFVRRAPVL
jgi:hypothetical protein